MTETITTVLQCEPVPGTDRMRITFGGDAGSHSFEITQAAIEALMPQLLSQPWVAGTTTVAANAITPIGCQPFESMQGLCGLAFNLGERSLHIGVPPNGIEHVRVALDAIELVYRNQKLPRMPG
jgi:hypothetical protein